MKSEQLGMLGPGILVRTISARRYEDKYGNLWQYHPRSDHHSKVACWVILFDLIRHCHLLLDHLASGQVCFGVNHRMRDFRNNREKRLDLVVCTRSGSPAVEKTFASLADDWSMALTGEEREMLAGLPSVPTFGAEEGGTVRLALEAKACMTKHGGARPRLYDELNSSHLTVHGAAERSIAVGFAMVNVAEEFLSPSNNLRDLSVSEPRVNHHKQPKATLKIVGKLLELPRRTRPPEEGFDAFGITLVDARNDCSEVSLADHPPALAVGDIYHYSSMVRRTADLYESKFS